MTYRTGEQNLADEIVDYLFTRTALSPAHQLTACESPIEDLFFRAMMAREIIGSCGFRDLQLISGATKAGLLTLQPQAKIGDMRVDFLCTVVDRAGALHKLVVECDGHDFHERTKDQAARDRSRDRTLQEMGHTVFRFTGSEIFNAPLKCACQVFDWALKCQDKG